MENKDKNYLDDKKNIIVMLIVIGLLTTATLVMLLSVSDILTANRP